MSANQNGTFLLSVTCPICGALPHKICKEDLMRRQNPECRTSRLNLALEASRNPSLRCNCSRCQLGVVKRIAPDTGVPSPPPLPR